MNIKKRVNANDTEIISERYMLVNETNWIEFTEKEEENA